MINTSYLTDKFKGQYRILCEYDLNTNDFPRKLDGSYEDIDCYISCQNKIRIYYVGNGILQAYIPSIGRAHNILKIINESFPDNIFNIEETDSEILFCFKYINSDKIIPLLKPKTSGAGISPFSSKNLPRNKDYKIPDEDLQLYKEILANIPENKRLSIGIITNNFIKSLVTKKNTYEDIKADMKKKYLKGKEYIYSINKWREYLAYLKNELKKDG